MEVTKIPMKFFKICKILWQKYNNLKLAFVRLKIKSTNMNSFISQKISTKFQKEVKLHYFIYSRCDFKTFNCLYVSLVRDFYFVLNRNPLHYAAFIIVLYQSWTNLVWIASSLCVVLLNLSNGRCQKFLSVTLLSANGFSTCEVDTKQHFCLYKT